MAKPLPRLYHALIAKHGELHPFDVLYLQHLLGSIQPGRYFTDAFGTDAFGYAGLEGGPVLVGLIAAAQQRG